VHMRKMSVEAESMTQVTANINGEDLLDNIQKCDGT
jgi:hypothetical protein